MDETAAPPTSEEDDGEGWTSPLIRGHRSSADRYVAGVLGGLGERFNVDPLILRVTTVAAAVALRDAAPPLIPALYAIGWIVIPLHGERSLLATLNRRRSLQEIGGATIAAVLTAFVAATPALWIAGALAAAAWLLLADRDPTETGDDQPQQSLRPEVLDAAPTMPARADGASGSAARWGRARRGSAEPLRALQLRPRRERPPKRSPALWPLTVGLLAAFAVTCTAIDRYSDPGLDPAIAVNGALLIVGGVLTLSAWRGRAGWPTLLAVPLIPLWIAFSATGIGRFDGEGDRTVQILDRPDEGTTAIEHGYGDLDISVSEDALPEGTTLNLTTEMTAGTTTIAVPADAPIAIRSRAGIGQVSVEGASSPWHTDAATVISNVRSRTYQPVATECYVERYSPAELEQIYEDWANHERPEPPPAGVATAPDFSDPATAQAAAAQEFLTQIAPNLRPEQGPSGLVWTASWDNEGHPCDPESARIEIGTINIDATIGIGEIRVVRTY